MAGDLLYGASRSIAFEKPQKQQSCLKFRLASRSNLSRFQNVLNSRIKFVESYVEKFAPCKARITTSACWRCYFQLGETKRKCGFVNSRRVTSYSCTFRLAFYLHFTVSTLQTAGNSEKLRTMLSLRTLL